MSDNQIYSTDEQIIAMLIEGYPIKHVEMKLQTSYTRVKRLMDEIKVPIKKRKRVFRSNKLNKCDAEIKTDFLNGMPLVRISWKYGFCTDTIKRSLIANGVDPERLNFGKINSETIDKVLYILGARKNGEKYSQIEQSLGITRQAICELIRKYGDQFDPNNENRRKKAGPKQEIEQTMTQTQYRLNEWQELMFKHPRCKYCDEDASEAAHIVAQTKANIARYGFHCIHNHRNMVPTCHAHNSTAMNECRGDAMRDEHMSEIKKALEDEGVIK